MPPAVSAYCYYIADGYVGYSFDGHLNRTEYQCPPSFYVDPSGSEQTFCLLEAGQRGFIGFPPNATAYCDELAQGRIGYTWATAT